jgi:RNA polymerase sigma factor FliA
MHTTTQTENATVVRFLPRIRKIARGIARGLPATVDVSDLEQAGLMGLVVAMHAYDASRGFSMDAYLLARIRGAILDELRGLDPLTRDQRRDARALKNARHSLEGELGRAAAEDEIAARAGVSVDRVREVRELEGASAPLSVEAGMIDVADRRTSDPVERIALEQMRVRLAAAITTLGERDQLVLQLYYVEELSLKEIGAVLGVTESRVCQLHGVAVKKLRGIMVD